MPNVTLHRVLADRVLDGWDRHPSDAPFDPADPEARNAFLQGAFGPDVGYFPGADPFLSDLAHYVRSGDLTRTLVRDARTPGERAYAWGWVTHVLADAELHPVVGEGVAWFLEGRRGGFVGISQDRVTHVRVEVGLDAAYSARHPRLREWQGAPVFHGRTVAWLARAYRSAYALEVDPTHLLASHTTAVRMANRARATIGVMGSAQAARHLGSVQGARWLLERALAVVHQGLDEESMLLAFLNPIPPPGWLRTRVQETVESFPDRFRRVYPDRIGDLPNYNLDTGRIEDQAPGTPCGRRTLAKLEALGGTGFPATARPEGAGARYPRPARTAAAD